MAEPTTPQQPAEYLAIGGYQIGQYAKGMPERRLEEFLFAAGIKFKELGAGVSLGTNERDVEIGFTATPVQRALIDLYIDHSGMSDVWEIMESEEL